MYDFLEVFDDPALKKAFRGPPRLWRTWRQAYPQLFDDADAAQAANQARFGYHFHEWLAAIRLHEVTGYRSLVGKYQFRQRHPHKFEIFARFVPEPVRALLPERGIPCGPDLFMYSDTTQDWFFAEAKRRGEPLTKSQAKLFPRLEDAWGHEIRVVRFAQRRLTRARS